jgi:hypothetical protein
MAKKTLFRLEFESEYRIVGLFCSERDYRLCWLLNNQLGYDFRRAPADFEAFSARTQSLEMHSVYHYKAPESMKSSFFIINNRSHNDITLFQTPPGLDYLFLVRADGSWFNFRDLLKTLRSMKLLSAAYQLDQELGKGKEGFLYDFEMFVTQEIDREKMRRTKN